MLKLKASMQGKGFIFSCQFSKSISGQKTQINIISHGLTSSTSPKHCGILLTENGKKGRNIQRKALDVHVYYF